MKENPQTNQHIWSLEKKAQKYRSLYYAYKKISKKF